MAAPWEIHEVIVNLIADTTTVTGLKVRCQFDTNVYPTGVQVFKADLAEVKIEHSQFHGEWNYVIRSRLLGVNNTAAAPPPDR